jgi:hypothetical protein
LPSNQTGKIYLAKPDSNGYSEIKKLDMPVNTPYQDCDPYIAPDESYLIIKSNRPGGYGDMDLYISYKKTDGAWTNVKNLGPNINTDQDDDVGDISPDGKYMFLTRNDDIYWVEAEFIDSLRYTNFPPYVKYNIPDITIPKDSLFTFQIPDSTFIDDDGNETLSLSAKLNNGNDLPDWLEFDSLTYTFSGIPDEIYSLSIRVTATDPDGAHARDSFRMKSIENHTKVENPEEVPARFSLYQNYPNPFNPATQIEYDLKKEAYVTLSIYNVSGQKIKTLVNN